MHDHEATPQIFLGYDIAIADFASYFNFFIHGNVHYLRGAEFEKEAFINGNYNVDDKHVLLTGLRRYDLLSASQDGSKKIVVMLTWMAWLSKQKSSYEINDTLDFRTLFQMFSEGALVVSDYSQVAIDFSYIYKTVVH